MVHVKLVENSQEIEHSLYREIFQSKVYALRKVLYYFERYEIEAVIRFEGRVLNKRLETGVIVECNDEVFKKVIEHNIDKFRQPAI